MCNFQGEEHAFVSYIVVDKMISRVNFYFLSTFFNNFVFIVKWKDGFHNDISQFRFDDSSNVVVGERIICVCTFLSEFEVDLLDE